MLKGTMLSTFSMTLLPKMAPMNVMISQIHKRAKAQPGSMSIRPSINGPARARRHIVITKPMARPGVMNPTMVRSLMHVEDQDQTIVWKKQPEDLRHQTTSERPTIYLLSWALRSDLL